MKPSPIYSRVAVVESDRTIYVSGLYGMKSQSGAEQTREIFASLGRLLEKTGSDFRHMAKATYYVSDEDASGKLNELRPNYYDAKRPPAASKAMVQGVGVEGKSITLDMIAVPAK
jgi:enamine deaminase RidA (YjgF/YER057c/UK114 family)